VIHAALAPKQGLPRTDRLRRRAEFLRVQGTGKRVQTPHFVVMVLAAEHQRLGVTVTRRTAGAVGRNRIKRLAREVFRRERALFPVNCEVVLVARSGADQLDYAALLGEIRNAQAALQRAAGQARSAPPPTTPS
jgi:ribonuclease P protein component